MESETDKELLHQGGGTMDIKEHLRTWHGFLSFVKWMIIGNVALLAFLACFRTHD
ncbi:MAG: aa3-type cytochrome c oxidase subunit IV [Rhizomicrobium sp.]